MMEMDDTVKVNGVVNDVLGSWIAHNQAILATINLNITEVCDSFIVFHMNGQQLQLVIPTSFQHEAGKGDSLDEVFLVTLLDFNADEAFQNAVTVVNEKLERVKITPAALMEALNLILMALQKLEAKKSAQNLHKSNHQIRTEPNSVEAIRENDSSDEENIYEYGYDLAEEESWFQAPDLGYRLKGLLYTFANDANFKCEAAKSSSKSDTTFALDGTLNWCTVNPDPKHLAIHCTIELAGIIENDNAILALGFSLNTPVKLTLEFSKLSWSLTGDSGTETHLKPDKILATQEIANCFEVNTARESFGGHLDKKIAHQCNDYQLERYGLNVLLPELVNQYFDFLEKRGQKDDIIKSCLPGNIHLHSELEKYTADINPFIGLLSFIGSRFKALPNWCVVCWSLLPYNVWILRTCDSDFCLYRFEELGLGSHVLQEVQTCPELIDFELSSALAAADSHRDVFEPFPAFLLEREEVRGRSGWFSKAEKHVKAAQTENQRVNEMFGNRFYSRESHLDAMQNGNKNLKVLQDILHGIPAIAAMQQCPDEASLKKLLSKLWNMNSEMDKKNARGKMAEPPEDLKLSKKWLPYDILRFILSTNRLSLHLLQGEEKLNFSNTVYQFAVLYGIPEREAHFEQRRTVEGGSFFAFHGSSSDNWFSILRNGLRSLSNTEYMSTGAAYGAGIYVARSTSTSLSYCRSSGGWAHGLLKDDFSVMAICEIVNNSIISTTVNREIMVVHPEHEHDVAIRYILVFRRAFDKKCSTFGTMSAVDRNCSISGTMLAGKTDLRLHFNNVKSSFLAKQQEEWNIRRQQYFKVSSTVSLVKKRDAEGESPLPAPEVVTKKMRALDSGHLASGMRRILSEYKNIIKEIQAVEDKKSSKECDSLPFLAGIKIHLADESDICRWRVSLSKELFRNYPLYEDLIACGRHRNFPELCIELECTFPDKYPFLPPFVRVISPKFMLHTGHVTIGGSICMELLTESGWSPAFTFESVIVQIVNAMIEGNGRLDRHAWSSHAEYSEVEAREAFDRVTQAHGWN